MKKRKKKVGGSLELWWRGIGTVLTAVIRGTNSIDQVTTHSTYAIVGESVFGQ